MTDLGPLITAVARAKQELALAESYLERATENLAEAMIVAQAKTVSYDDEEGVEWRATIVQTERVVIDGDQLRKHIGAVKYRRLCRQVVDNKLVEAAIRASTIDQDIVIQCSDIRLNKASIRLTKVEPDND